MRNLKSIKKRIGKSSAKATDQYRISRYFKNNGETGCVPFKMVRLENLLKKRGFDRQVALEAQGLPVDSLVSTFHLFWKSLPESDQIAAITRVFPSWGSKKGVKKPAKAKKLATTHKLGFYWSDAWRDLRYRVLVKFGRSCMACGVMGSPAHVDHIKPRSKYPELELTFDNLQVLCEACNMGKRAWDETDWRPKG